VAGAEACLAAGRESSHTSGRGGRNPATPRAKLGSFRAGRTPDLGFARPTAFGRRFYTLRENILKRIFKVFGGAEGGSGGNFVPPRLQSLF